MLGWDIEFSEPQVFLMGQVRGEFHPPKIVGSLRKRLWNPKLEKREVDDTSHHYSGAYQKALRGGLPRREFTPREKLRLGLVWGYGSKGVILATVQWPSGRLPCSWASCLLPNLKRKSAIRNKSEVEPRALRCCEQESALCCSCYGRRGDVGHCPHVGLEVTQVMAMAMNHVPPGAQFPLRNGWGRGQRERCSYQAGLAVWTLPTFLLSDSSRSCVLPSSSSAFAPEGSAAVFPCCIRLPIIPVTPGLWLTTCHVFGLLSVGFYPIFVVYGIWTQLSHFFISILFSPAPQTCESLNLSIPMAFPMMLPISYSFCLCVFNPLLCAVGIMALQVEWRQCQQICPSAGHPASCWGKLYNHSLTYFSLCFLKHF